MEKPIVVMAIYKPKEGQVEKLVTLIHQHFPTLKEYGLTTESAPFIGRSSNGAFIEVFEWASATAAKKAHDHPAVAKVWEAMAMVCDFERLENLPESKRPFPSFERAF